MINISVRILDAAYIATLAAREGWTIGAIFGAGFGIRV